MMFFALCLATFWTWRLLYTGLRAMNVPDIVVLLLLPVVALGLSLIPATWLFALGAGGAVLLLSTLFGQADRAQIKAVPRRRSNIPPVP